MTTIRIMLASLLLAGLALAKDWYSFPQTPAGQDRDIYLLRRPATPGYDNYTGTRNITGAALRGFANRSTVTVPRFTGFSTVTQAKLDGKSASDHQHAPVTYAPASMAVQSGTLDAGAVGDLAAVGGTTVAVSEAAGTPALRVQLSYTDVAAVNNVTLYGRYQGGSGHEVAVQAWHIPTGSWATLGLMATSTTNQWYSYPLINGSDYLNAGTALVRFDHLQTGNPAHDLYLDYAVVRYASDATAGGVTDHGSLTGLVGHDDHTQYALADGSRGNFAATSHGLEHSINGHDVIQIEQNQVTGLDTALAGKANSSHTQAAATITGLATVATSGSYPDLLNRPTIPAACVDVFDGAPSTVPGPPGKTVLNGTSDPIATDGTDGDFFLNTVTATLFGPKTSGAWGIGTSLVGPQGEQGPPGPPGTVDQPTVLGVIATQTDGALLEMQQGLTEAGTVPKLAVSNTSGAFTISGSGDGTLIIKKLVIQ